MKSDLGQAIRIGNSRCDIGGFTLRREDRRVGDIAYGRAGIPDERRVRFPGCPQVVWHRQSAKRLEATAAGANEQLWMPTKPPGLALDTHRCCVASDQWNPDRIAFCISTVNRLDVERSGAVDTLILNDDGRFVCTGDLQFP